MAWYAEEKARAGAFSSLLGLGFSDSLPESDDSVSWQAVAVGDSCLFHLSSGVMEAFPLTCSEDFNNRPYLLSTVSMNADECGDNFRKASGSCVDNDVFYLMTDALACWFLRRHEEGQHPDDQLLKLDSQDGFQRLINKERDAKDTEGKPYLRNDDVTLLRLVIRE